MKYIKKSIFELCFHVSEHLNKNISLKLSMSNKSYGKFEDNISIVDHLFSGCLLESIYVI